MNDGIDIGARLKSVRMAGRMSQRELARRSGVTNGMISQIEQNATSPSVSSLKRILDAIPMSLAEFFADEGDDLNQNKIFFRAHELRELNPNRIFKGNCDGELSLRQVGNHAGNVIQMLHERYAPGSDTGAELYSHEAEEAGIIVAGEIEIIVGDRSAVLGPGDAYCFDSRTPHRFRNLGDKECVIISACTPPSF